MSWGCHLLQYQAAWHHLVLGSRCLFQGPSPVGPSSLAKEEAVAQPHLTISRSYRGDWASPCPLPGCLSAPLSEPRAGESPPEGKVRDQKAPPGVSSGNSFAPEELLMPYEEKLKSGKEKTNEIESVRCRGSRKMTSRARGAQKTARWLRADAQQALGPEVKPWWWWWWGE